MKRRKLILFSLLSLGLIAAFLVGCASAPIQTEGVAPTTGAATEVIPPQELVFNGVSYPTDSTALTVGPYGLEQLQWATALTELNYIGDAPESWDFLAWLPTLTRLTLHLSAGETTDLRLDGYELPALETLEIDAECPIGTLTLPSAAPTDCSIRLSAVTRADTSAAEIDRLFLSLSDAPQELTLGQVSALTCDGFAPTPDALEHAVGLRELTLGTAQPLDYLTTLSALEKLSLYGDGWDLSPLRDTTISALVVPSCDTEALAVLDGMTSLRSLQISDACVTDLATISVLPCLETLAISVDEAQPGDPPFAAPLTAADAETLALLETPLPKEQLSAFLEHGGTLLLLPDYNR